jgi:hypothetical protein
MSGVGVVVAIYIRQLSVREDDTCHYVPWGEVQPESYQPH